MNEIENNNIFESIKHIDENGSEFWYARELMISLKYSEYRKFVPVIHKAIDSCSNSNQIVENHFVQVAGMVNIGSNAKRKVDDYKLSRYACYLLLKVYYNFFRISIIEGKDNRGDDNQ